MKILVLSLYYSPDLSAGSFRNTALVESLSKILNEGSSIQVLTTHPNRYGSYKLNVPDHEVSGNTEVIRIRLRGHNNGLLNQSLMYFKYVYQVWKITHLQDYDLVYASSSRLLTAFLGASISRWKRIPFYVDIRDIFTENIGELYSSFFLAMVLPIFRLIERFVINQAQCVNLVSPGFLPYFKKINPGKTYHLYTNGIDEIHEEPCVELRTDDGVKELLYAGNIGDGQGLHKIIPKIAQRLGSGWVIRIVGDGTRRSLLEASVRDCSNVAVENPVSKEQLVNYYQQATVLFLHLNESRAFERVIPSKIFEYAATGKPIIAGVKGYPKHFLSSQVKNAMTFRPCDIDGFIDAIQKISLDLVSRDKFISRYRRDFIMTKMAKDILKIL